MDNTAVQALLAQLGLAAPAAPASPYLSPDLAASLGLPFPAPRMGEMPGSAPAAQGIPPMGGMPMGGAPPMGPLPAGAPPMGMGGPPMGGYTPQPRPALPAPIANGPDVLGPFRDLYAPPPAPVNPLAGLSPAQQGPPPSRALTPPWMPQGGQMAPGGLSPSDQAFLAAHPDPAYRRVVDRVNELRAMRARRGY